MRTKATTGWFTTVAVLALLVSGAVMGQDENASLGANEISAVRAMGDMDGETLGSSRLHRNGGGVSVNVRTTGLDMGHAYTLWWVIFNHPEYCVDGCDSADFPANGGDPRVEASQLYADGHVVVDVGSSRFGSHLSLGDVSGAEFGPGLLDPLSAEIHMVVRTHGAVIPDQVGEQTLTLSGGCNPECINLQAALHKP